MIAVSTPKAIQHDRLTDALQSAANFAMNYGVPCYVERVSYYDGTRFHIGYDATRERPGNPARIVALYLPEGAAA